MAVVIRRWLRWWAHQRWIRFGLRDRLLRLVAAPEKMQGRVFVTDFCGYRYHGDLGSFVDWNIYFYGAYEPGILALLARLADQAGPSAVFLDVGANVGQHSLHLAHHTTQVHAFEPWPVVRNRFEATLRDNGVANVQVHPFALGAENALLPFYAPASANLGTGSFRANVNLNTPAGVLEVRRGDDVVAELGLARIDIIKIDTEGFELPVLAGLAQTLRRYSPVVVVEIALAEQQNLDVPALFPSGWAVMMAGEHPERQDLFPFDPQGLAMVTVVAGPQDKIARLLSGRGGAIVPAR